MGRWGDGGDRGDGEMGRLVLSGAEVWGDGAEENNNSQVNSQQSTVNSQQSTVTQ
ncbi:hypothetical protein [Nostoc linckia]|uniref:hypothetical protein n=1 Tax=Nostoc linckia TaxID=92942 RepID=UPI0015D50190|nr:hypothetical protein [Nostoc linckia]